jgi:lysyl endopeptidase
MNNRFYTSGLALLLFVTLSAGMALGADAEPAASRWSVRPLAEVARHLAPGLDREALSIEDQDRREQGLPDRFAVPEEVSLTPDDAGTWETLPSGRSLWRLRINSPGVISLNLGFTRFWLPAEARMLVYSATGEGPVLAFDESDNAAHGELWTSVLLTEEVVVELEVDPGLRWQVDLELTSIGRGYRFFGEDLADKSGFCNIDVVCPEGDPWRDEIDTVGVYSLGGSTFCTGFMVNNTAENGKPYFMTAYHCDIRANLAPSIVVYWNYQSPTCGQHGGGSLVENQNGSTLVAEYEGTDVTLLELDDLPDPAFEVKYAGWNRGTGVPTSAVAIHHPGTDEKSISFENDPLTITSYQSYASPGDGTHLRVTDWDLGTTEGGSSGSPLFDQNQYVVGQLHGGAAACNNNQPDWYARFHNSWTGGGTSDTRLRDWLDPQGTGAMTVETIDPSGSSFEVTPADGFVTSGIVGGPFDPENMIYTLTNTGDKAASFVATVEAHWLTVSPASGSIPVGGTAGVTVGLGESALNLSVGQHQSSLQIANTGLGAGSTARAVTVTVSSNVPQITGVVPNPFGSGAIPETEIRFTMGGAATVRARIVNILGRRVKDLGSMAAVAGENHFTWDGTGQYGALQAAGAYIFILDASGREEKISLMLIH